MAQSPTSMQLNVAGKLVVKKHRDIVDIFLKKFLHF